MKWISKTEERKIVPTTQDSTGTETTAKQGQKPQSPGANGSPSTQPNLALPYDPVSLENLATPADQNTSSQPQPPVLDKPLTHKASYNYLVYEVDQQPSTPKPNWSQTMHAVFGNHVDWNEVKVYNTRNRPLGLSLCIPNATSLLTYLPNLNSSPC